MVLTLKEKKNLVDNVWSFVFESDEPIEYVAGDYTRVRLDHENPDDEGPKRWFTNSAAPYEGVVRIVTRITDSTFKQALVKLEPGDTSVELIHEHEGDFVWKETDLPVLFVAGGIGITPFHSILKQRVHEGKNIPVTLLYSGRSMDLPFKDEFAQYEKDHPEFKVEYLIGDRISAELLAEKYPELNSSVVYLSGPEPMVEAVGNQLKEGGLPEDQLLQDWFPNYTDENF